MSRRPACALCLVACGVLLAGAPAAAAPKRITGKLSRPGYTVIAIAASGKGNAARATPGFSLRPPAGRVTLHLEAPDGVYAGPVVVATGKRGKRAIVGVKAGTRLGLVRINSRGGYAKVSRKLARKQIDRRRWARAKKGVPIGAGRFGLVRSRVGRSSPPGDLDADGIADPLDIDDNGNHVLDRYESQGGARAAGRRGGGPVATAAAVFTGYFLVLAVNDDGSVRGRLCPNGGEATGTWPADAPPPIVGKSYLLKVDFRSPTDATVLSVSGPVADGCPAIAHVPSVTPGLFLTLKDTVNANAAALTVADLDETLSRRGFLLIQGPAQPDATVELDCGGARDPGNPGGWSGGLSYCTAGGTGRAVPTPAPGTPPRSWPLAFPDCCDSDGDGFGELAPLASEEQPCMTRCVSAFFSPGATADQIGTGDVLNWRVTQDGAESQFPTTLPDVVATVPALVSYRDGAGNSATVSYPVPPPYVGDDPDYLGPYEGPYQGFPIARCPAGAPPPCVEGDVVLTLEFWRPQRAAIPGAEEGQWTDIGGLVYSPGLSGPWTPPFDQQRSAPSLPRCDPDHLSTTDPHLTVAPSMHPFGDGYGFRDSAADRPADPANTLSFSVNVTRCLGRSPESGENVSMWLIGRLGTSAEGTGGATQELLFTME
jgi:hypothetical protein